MTFKYLSYIILLLLTHKCISLSCQHNRYLPSSSLSINSIPSKYSSSPNLRLTSSPPKPFTPIRIHIDYTTLNNQTTVPSTYKSKIKQILELSKSSFESLLKVQRFKDTLRLLHCNNKHIQISPTIQSKGVDADLIIFPYIDTSTNNSNYEAYASPCILAGDTHRPVAGYIAFTQILKLNKQNWLKYYTALAMHELTHCLVFSPNLYPFYINPNTHQPLGIHNIIKTKTVNGIKRTLIATPKVVATAQRHFNCTNIEGVELENQGSEGTAGSHWEARQMLTDYMMGASYDEVTISEITLALFEDSGWYKVNMYTGGLFRFGKNEGCAFMNGKCMSDNKSNFKNEFCDMNYTPYCSNGRLNKGICYYSKYKDNIDTHYQYFDNNNSIGGLMLADYCPVSQVVNDKDMLMHWNCAIGKESYPTTLGEVVSEESICFISSLRPKGIKGYEGKRSICYRYECDYEMENVMIWIGNRKLKCVNGVVKDVDGWEGEVECPEFRNVCTSKVRCFDFIDCIEKKAQPVWL